MGPYEEILQAAEGLQFQPPPADTTQHSDGLSQAQQIVQQASQLHDLELHLSAVLAAVACRTVTDQKQLATRAASLQRISSTLQLITASKDSIADHLRSASVRPSVPVAPEFQPDFANMLRCAASNAAVLQEGLHVLQWAASLTDKPSCWEDNLHVIRVSAQGLKENVLAMKEFDQQLSISTTTPAAGQQRQ